MLDDGKAKTGAALFAAPVGIDAVKPLGDPGQMQGIDSLAPVDEPEAAAPGEPPFPAGPDPEGLSAVADPETRESLRAIGRRATPHSSKK